MLQVTHKQQQNQVSRDTWHEIINLFEHLQHRLHIDTVTEIYCDYVEQSCHLEEDFNDGEKTHSLSADTARALSAASLLYDINGLY